MIFKKTIIDILPVASFLLTFKLSNHPHPLIPATLVLLVVTGVILITTYIRSKKIAFIPLISALFLLILGGLTIISGNEIFIKIKPTIVNSLFAITLFIGYFFHKPPLKYLFSSAINLSEKAWLNLSFRWGCFFLFLAILNEIIWRNFSTNFWVYFKIFGIFPISATFALLNIPYILKESKKVEKI